MFQPLWHQAAWVDPCVVSGDNWILDESVLDFCSAPNPTGNDGIREYLPCSAEIWRGIRDTDGTRNLRRRRIRSHRCVHACNSAPQYCAGKNQENECNGDAFQDELQLCML